jgi:pSer/pThr/pTyr-binding forkhead associated (FHA) protein
MRNMATVTVFSSGAEPKVVELKKPATSIGRDPKSDIFLDNLAISKHHCQIVAQGAHYLIRDQGSSNKTFVNGKDIIEQPLNDGDEIMLGNFRLKFSAPESAVTPRPFKVSDDGFEPTLQLPPEMLRKKMEELRQQQSGVPARKPSQAAPAAAGAADNGSAKWVVTLIIAAVALVLILDLLLVFKVI